MPLYLPQRLTGNASGFGARKTSDQSIASTAWTAVTFADGEYHDVVNSGDAAMHDLVTNPSRIYLRYAGLWKITACVGLNTTGCTTLGRVYKNGAASVPCIMMRETTSTGIGTSLFSDAVFAAGDYFEVQFWHDKVSATNIGDYVGGTYVYATYMGAV